MKDKDIGNLKRIIRVQLKLLKDVTFFSSVGISKVSSLWKATDEWNTLIDLKF